MTEKQKVQDYYAAGVHWITAGVAVPFLIETACIVLIFPILHLVVQGSVPDVLFAEILQIVSIWLAVKYSARYVLTRYNFAHPLRVVNMSTIYLCVLLASLLISEFFLDPPNVVFTSLMINIPGAFISALVFYYESKKSLT